MSLSSETYVLFAKERACWTWSRWNLDKEGSLTAIKKRKKKEKERLDEYNKRNEISSEKGTYPLDEDSSSH